MPESEPKPKLIELVGPGAGQGWKAVLRNGKPAVVHEIPVPPAEATAAVPRLQRLYEHRHPALSPVLAWGTDQSGVWVAVEPNEGTPLGSILSRGPLTPPAAAAIGAAVLSGVAALHEAGIALGGFGATAVRVTTNGDIRLAGHPAAAVRAAPSQSDLRADVRSCGMAVCAAFGVDPAGAPAPPNISPGLVVTMRSMASGAMGPSADRAQAALREMAAALLSPDREMAAQSELATRAGGRELPPITPFLPEGTVAPKRPRPRRRPPHRRRLLPPSRRGRTHRHAPPLPWSRRRGRPTRPRHQLGHPWKLRSRLQPNRPTQRSPKPPNPHRLSRRPRRLRPLPRSPPPRHHRQRLPPRLRRRRSRPGRPSRPPFGSRARQSRQSLLARVWPWSRPHPKLRLRRPSRAHPSRRLRAGRRSRARHPEEVRGLNGRPGSSRPRLRSQSSSSWGSSA